MRILVTGATGFVGDHVINALLSAGHNVIATSTNNEKAQDRAWYKQLHYIPYLISGKPEVNLYDHFLKPDLLIHLAWAGLPNYQELFHYEENLWNDYWFLKNLTDNGLKDLTVTGTCFEYGLKNGQLQEDQAADPQNPYALAKDTLRKFLETLQKKQLFTFKWIRLFYMHGKGQSEKSLIPQLQKALATNEASFNMSKGDQIRDYLTIEEVAANILAIALQNKVQGIINCCSGKPLSVRELVESYMEASGKHIHLNLGYYPYPTTEPFAFWGDNSKLNKIVQAL